MGRIVVRRKTEVKKAYEIPGLKMKVFTPEELVYVCYQNLPRLEPQIMNEEMLSWLKDCGRETLSERLAQSAAKGAEGLAGFVITLFSGISFYSEKEIQEAKEALLEWNQADPNMRKKEKLDYLFESGRVQEAMDGYDELIRERDTLSDGFLAAVYHNRGVACARLFLFEEAALSFQRAWELSGAPDSKEHYMLSLRMSLPKESYVNRIAEEGLGEEKAVELEEKLLELLKREVGSENRHRLIKLKKQKEIGNQAYYEEELHALAEDLKQTWRKRYGDF